MTLEVKFQASFVDINITEGLKPIDRKFLISILNGYEDAKWRIEIFEDFIWDNIAESALSKRERENAILGDRSRLRAAAKNLRLVDADPQNSKGSEIAEIVLYGVMKMHFKAISAVPKIFYKQNPNDYAKGADSVHIVVNGDEFLLFLGEAKFYKSIEDANLGKIIASVGNMLDTEKLKKENSIITNLHELDDYGLDPSIVDKIKNTLSSRASIDDLKPRLHIPILIVYECEITASTTELSSDYIKATIASHIDRANSYFAKQIEKLASQVMRYTEVTFHLILVPVPSKSVLVDRFVAEAKSMKGKKDG